MKSMTGHEYEYQCAKKLKQCGFSNVSVTRGSGDQGIDIIAYKNGAKYGIQCKYYSHPVGNGAVQEAFAGAKYYHCDFASVMTNTTFTKSAKELATSTGVILWDQNTLPYSVARSPLGKWIGTIVLIFSLFDIIGLIVSKNLKYPVLQWAFAIVLLFAGLAHIGISTIEYADWSYEGSVGFLYLIATIISAITSSLLGQPAGNATFLSFALFLITAIRALWFYVRTGLNKNKMPPPSSETK